VAIGWSLGRIINTVTNYILQRQDMRPENFWVVPLWLVIFGVGFSIIVSLFAGLYPASRASRLDPVQALRHD
jgi:putative ABC transport system permease protein